jgi:RNA polymerase sigma-54 factor
MFATSDPANRIIGQYLIDMVDEDGYLRTDLPQLCVRLGASENTVMETLKILQGFDPVGVMARNLQECMEIQLKDKGRFDPEIAIFIQHLDLLAAHDFPKLKKLCNCDDEDIADMIAEVRNLDPRPGLAFGTVPVQPVIPDVKVYQRNDGSWHVELNTGVLPRVLVNQVYYTTVSKNARSRKEKEYISQCMQNASWLVKSLDQRARTILKVSEEIVRQQDGFFVHGVEHLRPLNLKDVANAISMHESTVSRVTSNKYMATTRGIFELKYFFTSAVTSSEEGAVHSSEAVRHKIKVLIDNENPGKVLSDNKIVEILKADDIEIARRTVAKYREAMRIPSSVQRRREKKLR